MEVIGASKICTVNHCVLKDLAQSQSCVTHGGVGALDLAVPLAIGISVHAHKCEALRVFRRHELERFAASLKKEDGLLLLYDPVFKTEAIAKQRLEHEPLIIGHRRIDRRRVVLSS